jgi:hypothetical protein
LEAQAMRNYRIYQVSRDMKINGVPEKVQYETDQEVIAHAKKNLGGLDVEILGRAARRDPDRAIKK